MAVRGGLASLTATPFHNRKAHMEIVNYTIVYLRSGRTAIVYGCENNLEGSELVIYPDDKDKDPAVFNWDHVEMFQTGETEIPEKKDVEDDDRFMGLGIKDLDIPDDPGSLLGYL